MDMSFGIKKAVWKIDLLFETEYVLGLECLNQVCYSSNLWKVFI